MHVQLVTTALILWAVSSVGSFVWMRAVVDPDEGDPGTGYHLISAPFFGLFLMFVLFGLYGFPFGNIRP